MSIFFDEPDYSSFSAENDQSKYAKRGGIMHQAPNTEQRDNTLDRTSFGGRATQYGPNGEVYASSGQQAAANYTSLGQAAAQRGAYQNDWTQANASRGQQGQAMALMQNAAYGGAPSAAQIQGRNMLDQSLQNQMAAAASARGGSLAQAAAMRNAATLGDAARQQGMNNLAALRAQEMAQARGDYFGAASGVRGQDFQQQGMNMQSELAQRQLNQQGQQFYDEMGWNTLRADQQAAMNQANIDSQEYIAQKRMNEASEDRKTKVQSSLIGAVGGFLGGLSDMRSKTGVQPVTGMMLSDASAKRAAFEEGAKYADAQHAGVQVKAPDYAKHSMGERAMDAGARGAVRGAVAQPAAVVVAAPPAQPAAAPAEVSTLDRVRQHPVTQGLARAAMLPLGGFGMTGAMVGNDAGHQYATSDERAKEVIDLDATSMRDGSSEPRTYNFDKSFRRDTPADQVRVKRAYEDKAGRDADDMMAGFAASLAKGPSTQEAMARANRSMEGSSYAYKPEFTPPEQEPGEKNVGPMAQNMAADPLASTAVKKDPQSGMLMLDGQKMLKLNSAGIASLQRQVDSLAAAVAKRGRS